MINFLIVLYDKSPSDSLTLHTLSLHIKKYFLDFKVIVWNNGPNPISFEERKLLHLMFDNSISMIETLENMPLSKIYNDFMAKNTARFYCILDDDTNLTDRYLQSLSNFLNRKDDSLFVVSVPQLSHNSKKESPKYFPIDSVNCTKFGGYFFAAMSGVVFNHNVRNLIEMKYIKVFDERFPFYGIDNVFFYRLKKLNILSCIKILNDVPLEHSFSRHEGEQSYFRKYNRALDVANFLKYYFGLRSSIRFIMFFLRAVVNKDFENIKLLFKVF